MSNDSKRNDYDRSLQIENDVSIKEEELISLIELCFYEVSPSTMLNRKNREIKKLKEEVKSLKDKYEKTIWYVLGPTKQ